MRHTLKSRYGRKGLCLRFWERGTLLDVSSVVCVTTTCDICIPRVSAVSSHSSGTCRMLSARSSTTRSRPPPPRDTHLLAIEQHGQIVRHFSLVANNPRERTGRRCACKWLIAALTASKQSALAPQLLQVSFGCSVCVRSTWTAIVWGRCARGHVERWWGLESLERSCRAADRLDGGIR